MNYVMELDFDSGLQLLAKAKEHHREKRAWDIYCAKYPSFTDKNFIPFDKFYTPAKPVAIKSTSHIFAEANKLKKLFTKEV